MPKTTKPTPYDPTIPELEAVLGDTLDAISERKAAQLVHDQDIEVKNQAGEILEVIEREIRDGEVFLVVDLPSVTKPKHNYRHCGASAHYDGAEYCYKCGGKL